MNILFVCLGNICRSPAAECIFKHKAHKAGLAVTVDSAGTSAWHAGEKADRRMQQTAKNRGYELTSISRPVTSSDFDKFDYLIAMDDHNYDDLRQKAGNAAQMDKVLRMRDFFSDKLYDHVPDPYYGGDQGFETVINLLEDASDNLIKFIQKQ
ncbi:MAG: low molecular weight protein-tyrosine-phosphatase [Bacteroidales bacterium]|jgi:protein-tyrosine phosphatase|nr:low molecular weight phosphotyrosine protein phosphatase [Bacteroidales bacterium]MDY0084987.1 low molecular weight protein-tyrosine-phosphatase [Bacteroidales bacterium]